MGTGYRPEKKLWVPMGSGYRPEKIFGYRWVPGTGQKKIFGYRWVPATKIFGYRLRLKFDEISEFVGFKMFFRKLLKVKGTRESLPTP